MAALLIDTFQPLQTRKSIKLDAVNATRRKKKFRRQNVTLRQGGIVAPPAAGSNGLSRNGAADHAPAKTPHTHTQSSFHHFAASGHFWSTESLGRSLKMREKNGASSGAATLIRT